jgi:peroxiredoxin
MHLRMPNRRLLPALVLVVVTASALLAAAAPPAVGEKAPDVALPAVSGPDVTLSALLAKGPAVVIVSRGWVGYQCPFCTRQFGDFLAHAAEIESLGATVVWIYPGPAAEVQQRAQEAIGSTPIPANFRFLLDPDYAFTVAWDLRWDAPKETAYPSTFVVDRGGVVRMATVSRSHGDRVPAQDVVAALKALPR